MTYTKQTWADGSGGGTPISAARLDHIEQGIYDASTGTFVDYEPYLGEPVTTTGPSGIPGMFVDPFHGDDSGGWWALTYGNIGNGNTDFIDLMFSVDPTTSGHSPGIEFYVQGDYATMDFHAPNTLFGAGGISMGVDGAAGGTYIQAQAYSGQTDPLIDAKNEDGDSQFTVGTAGLSLLNATTDVRNSHPTWTGTLFYEPLASAGTEGWVFYDLQPNYGAVGSGFGADGHYGSYFYTDASTSGLFLWATNADRMGAQATPAETALWVNAASGQTSPLIRLRDENGNHIHEMYQGGDYYIHSPDGTRSVDLWTYDSDSGIAINPPGGGGFYAYSFGGSSSINLIAEATQVDPLLVLKNHAQSTLFQVEGRTTFAPLAASGLLNRASFKNIEYDDGSNEVILELVARPDSTPTTGEAVAYWDVYSDPTFKYTQMSTFIRGGGAIFNYVDNDPAFGAQVEVDAAPSQNGALLVLKDETGAPFFLVRQKAASTPSSHSSYVFAQYDGSHVGPGKEEVSGAWTATDGTKKNQFWWDLEADTGDFYGGLVVSTDDGIGSAYDPWSLWWSPSAVTQTMRAAVGQTDLIFRVNDSSNAPVFQVSVAGGIGLFGATPPARAAHPITLSDVITILTDVGVCV